MNEVFFLKAFLFKTISFHLITKYVQVLFQKQTMVQFKNLLAKYETVYKTKSVYILYLNSSFPLNIFW